MHRFILLAGFIFIFGFFQYAAALECYFCQDQYENAWPYAAKIREKVPLCRVCSLVWLNMQTIMHNISANQFISEIFGSDDRNNLIDIKIKLKELQVACKAKEFFAFEFEDFCIKVDGRRAMIIPADIIAVRFVAGFVDILSATEESMHLPCCIKINSITGPFVPGELIKMLPDAIPVTCFPIDATLKGSPKNYFGFAYVESSPKKDFHKFVYSKDLKKLILGIDQNEISFLSLLFPHKVPETPIAWEYQAAIVSLVSTSRPRALAEAKMRPNCPAARRLTFEPGVIARMPAYKIDIPANYFPPQKPAHLEIPYGTQRIPTVKTLPETAIATSINPGILIGGEDSESDEVEFEPASLCTSSRYRAMKPNAHDSVSPSGFLPIRVLFIRIRRILFS